jgi:hypothetical protein
MSRMRPAFSGAKITTVSGTSTATAIPAGSQGFWLSMAAAGFVLVNASATPFAMTAANSGPVAAGLYGPFEFSPGQDRYVHVAGDGGTPVATITFV